MPDDSLTDPGVQKLLHEYTKAIEQEWEEKNPSVDDTPEEISKKARSLVIENLPVLLGKATQLALSAGSDAVSLSAIKFLYNIIVPPTTRMEGEPDPMTKLIEQLQNND
jgi:hypothetical protein